MSASIPASALSDLVYEGWLGRERHELLAQRHNTTGAAIVEIFTELYGGLALPMCEQMLQLATTKALAGVPRMSRMVPVWADAVRRLQAKP